MREIVLDTETTGFSPDRGDRLVEIGCLELVNHVATGATYHTYINPERSMPKDAFEVHGLSEEFLSDKPLFHDVADAFLDFVADDKLVIHNASFDMGFINFELTQSGRAALPMAQAIDTVAMARKKFPGAQASLDALCRRFGIDNSHRTKHGALLDAELLAEVYLELMGGRQAALGLAGDGAHDGSASGLAPQPRARRPEPLPPRLTEEEKAAHAEFIASLGGEPLWARLGD